MTSSAPDPVDHAKSGARRQFDAWAAAYDRSILNRLLFRPSYLLMLDEVARWLRERSDAGVSAHKPFRLLDAGCGTATFATLLRGTGWPLEVLCLDYSFNMCAAARAKLSVASFTSSGENTLGVAGVGDTPSGSVDGALTAITLETCRRTAVLNADSEHLPFDSQTIDVITCANSFHHYPRQARVIQEMHRVLRPGGRFILLDGFRDNCIGWFVFDVVVTGVEKNVHHATWRELDAMFRDAGFTRVDRRRQGVIAPVLATIGTR